MQKKWIIIPRPIDIRQKNMLCITVTWNDLKFLRSQVVFDARYASDITDEAKLLYCWKHCNNAVQQKSRCRQNNGSTVDSSCTSLEFTIQHERVFKGMDVMQTLQTQKLKKTTDYLVSGRKLIYGTIVECCLEDERYQMRMHGTRTHAIGHGII